MPVIATITDNKLSPRERQVLAGLAGDSTPKELAIFYGISLQAVKTYLLRAKRKLGVTSAAAAVAEAIRKGWL